MLAQPILRSVLTWNTNQPELDVARLRNVMTAIDDLIDTYQPSIIALQEAGPALETRLKARRYETRSRDLGKPGVLVTGLRPDHWTGTGVAPHPSRALVLTTADVQTAREFVIVNAHLSSRRSGGSEAARTKLEELKFYLSKFAASHDEVICGDLNLNPYETKLHYSSELNAARSRAWARSQRREHLEHCPPRYNPSWQLLAAGAAKEIYGTYFYTGGSDPDKPWHVFDQVIFSKSLALHQHSTDEIIAVTSTTSVTLSTADGRPNAEAVSDHYPVIARFGIH